MEKFYHVSYNNYSNGQILEPGNWGNLTQNFPKINEVDVRITLIENIFEQIRRETEVALNKKLVSRFNCVFACKTMDGARLFRERYRGGAQIYEIEVEDSTPIILADFYFITTPPSIVTKIKEFARYYWEGKRTNLHEFNHSFEEALIGGSVKITHKIE